MGGFHVAKSRSISNNPTASAQGLQIERRFTKPGVHPFDEVEWELRTAAITNEKGEVVFEQTDVEIPKSWSQMATNVVVSKYFRGQVGKPERERSVKHLIGRVVDTITDWGKEQGYFASPDDAEAFEHELAYLLVTQRMAFNSPVWFNVGVEAKPQGSACFINSIEDTMESILGLAKTEGMLFKYGSGAGVNLSPLRGSMERLKHGGTASGPVSFMKGFDAFAGAIKSGGATRRAAKMVILNVDHPDIEEFINCKVNEEKKAWALIDAGYDGAYTGEAYGSVFFQNSNNSIRVPDEFMKAVENDGSWTTKMVTDGSAHRDYKARDLMRQISDAAWICGDPGMQYDTTIQDWNCVANTAKINATNPCSEFVFIDDTACNLASLNLLTFIDEGGRFNVEDYKHAVRITITAQEMIVPNASYPSPKIGENSHKLRPLGLGYANLGALLMSEGLAYDSDEGRAYAAALTSLMTGEAYAQSARIAATNGGPFELFETNREPMLRVMNKHKDASYAIDRNLGDPEITEAACHAWDEAVALGIKHGYRNAQATVLAPTGTIAFMMDCDTTGVEPDIALVKYKKLVGGGLLKIVNNTVPRALRKLGYSDAAIKKITDFIAEHDTIEGAPGLKAEHLPVFDCAFKANKGERSIHYMGHLKMVAATQPFISGSISKTINLPELASVEDIEQAYVDGWKMGLKCISVYRDNCKRSQPLNTSLDKAKDRDAEVAAPVSATPTPLRRKLPDERRSITHKFDIQGHEGYITVSMFDDGTPGEIFVKMAKEGSTLSGMMDSFAIMVSLALQYGVPLPALVGKFSHVRFEPSGYTSNPEIPIAKSIVDYIFRWLASKFYSDEDKDAIGLIRREPKPAPVAEPQGAAPAKESTTSKPKPKPDQSSGSGSAPEELRVVAGVGGVQAKVTVNLTDSMTCSDCGAIMVRAGACYKCLNCGSTSGCG
jgi:ribonucleoside-diphosphate reductase alpha chain